MIMMMVKITKDLEKYSIVITLQGIMMTKTKVEIALNHRSLFILTMMSLSRKLAGKCFFDEEDSADEITHRERQCEGKREPLIKETDVTLGDYLDAQTVSLSSSGVRADQKLVTS